MDIKGAVALVTGANGGIGGAFVAELLERGAAKVYVAARRREALGPMLGAGDGRLSPLVLDVTDLHQIAEAATCASDVTLLVNNAGYAAFKGAIAAATIEEARREMDVNYYGTLAVARAFAPVLASAGGGAMVNMLSMLSLISLPVAATYSASKAAALSVTRSIRAELVAQRTQVVGVLAVQTETAMGLALPEPRMKPREVASAALDAVEAGVNDEIAAGAQTKGIFDAFTADPRSVQSAMSKVLPRAG